MDEIQRQYPIETIDESKRTSWYMEIDSYRFLHLPEELIDKYLPQLIHSLQDYFENESRARKIGYRAITLGNENERFYVVFNDNVLDFLKLHDEAFLERMVKIGVTVAWKRNCNIVQMRDIQPYLAVVHRTYINDPTGLEYFLAHRTPAHPRRSRTLKWLR